MTVLAMEGIARHYGRRAVLRDIQLTIDAGERVALQGPNGSGKTTLLRIAAGTLRGTAGTVKATGRVAYLPQDAPVYRELSPVDHLRFVARMHEQPFDFATAITQLQDAGLHRHADRPTGTLSRGQRQRLGLCMALGVSPDLLVLDEPWTALDHEGRQWLQRHLDESDAAMLVALHEGTPFQPDRALLLDGGRLQ